MFADGGSGLTTADLGDVSNLLGATLMMCDDQDVEAAFIAFKEVMVPLAQNPPTAALPSWLWVGVCAMYVLLMEPLIQAPRPPTAWGVRLDSPQAAELMELLTMGSRACPALLERAVADAEAEGDDGRLAYAALRLVTHMLFERIVPVPVSGCKVLVENAATDFAAARPWLPTLHRQLLNPQSLHSEVFRLANAGTVKTGISGLVDGRVGVQASSLALPVPPPLRSCAQCGAHSTGCMVCGGCRCIWYCAPSCQVS